MRNFCLKIKAYFGLPHYTDVPEPEGYELIRLDDFDHLSDYWSKELPWQAKNEYFDYDPSQVFIHKAMNLLSLRLSRWGKYGAGLVCTKPLFTSGNRIEIKARFDKLKGFFPALWLWSIPPQREYDIMECTGGRVWMSAHKWNGDHEISRGNFSMTLETQNWHIYEIELLADRVNWYLNGQLVQTHKKWLPDNPCMLIMSVGCTGEYNTTGYTPTMDVDWVKIYTRE